MYVGPQKTSGCGASKKVVLENSIFKRGIAIAAGKPTSKSVLRTWNMYWMWLEASKQTVSLLLRIFWIRLEAFAQRVWTCQILLLNLKCFKRIWSLFDITCSPDDTTLKGANEYLCAREFQPTTPSKHVPAERATERPMKPENYICCKYLKVAHVWIFPIIPATEIIQMF